MAHGANALKSILYALFANSSIAIAKGVAAFFTGSSAMLAEAIHSAADAANQLLLLLGLKQAKKPPNPDYPLGFGKSIYFWSFLVAIMLFSVGGIFSIYEGMHKLSEPGELSHPYVAIGVLVFAIIAEGLSLLGCMREVNKIRNGRSYTRWFRETRESALLVVFGEDIAALLGLIFALVAVILTMVTGNPMFDAIGTLMIGVLLVVIAIFIAIEVKALLIGQGVEPPLREKMLRFLSDQEEVHNVYNLLTMQLGDDVMVAVKAQMAKQDSATSMVGGINQVEKRFRAEFPQVAWLFFEPDQTD